jgi:hypothetical protein
VSCVLTLALDEPAQARFEAMRQRWFPPELNRIPAHLTLFHTLPEAKETADTLARVAASVSAFSMRVVQVRSIGRGVAFFLDAVQANRLHGNLRVAFADVLSAQDRQGFKPHVVAQNKVSPAVAKDTLALLQAGFQPWTCQAVGLDLWRYMGGPWEFMRRFEFGAQAR